MHRLVLIVGVRHYSVGIPPSRVNWWFDVANKNCVLGDVFDTDNISSNNYTTHNRALISSAKCVYDVNTHTTCIVIVSKTHYRFCDTTQSTYHFFRLTTPINDRGGKPSSGCKQVLWNHVLGTYVTRELSAVHLCPTIWSNKSDNILLRRCCYLFLLQLFQFVIYISAVCSRQIYTTSTIHPSTFMLWNCTSWFWVRIGWFNI